MIFESLNYLNQMSSDKHFNVVKCILIKVRMYEEIMTNNDNPESNLLTSSLLKKTSGLHAGTS